jgi:mono/diheme cytochrome c family protein
MHRSIWSVAAALVALVAACGGGQNEANAPHPADQVAWGEQLFAKECADCHGKQGEGHDAPALVGKNALPLDPPAGAKLRKSQFHTAQDVFDFVKKAMPPKEVGSLSDEQIAAILAFDLKANGVDLVGKHVDATTASSFVLHP